ncbi:MMPL family transporter [Solirubrobacter sp. CPCC 204708]|uniref:MMPL family transporter n=1 Tax=Solirubrobacter deserti TaxID=2282478 RepID=A0ABT4RHB1_9ACTN|nr:MMPL family transporter [Solirubrobacter deserti]MBE2315260.1 MMPL family transporter [Solirubrobacter deserti]MDA0137944.1 MMPL family transporter [Solirubrobacter deserti]
MPVTRLARLGAFAFRRRRLVLAAWVGALVAAFALAATFSADYNTPGSDSKAAADALADRFPATSPDTVDVVWRTAEGTPTALLREASTLPGLAAAGEPQISPDGQVGVARIPLTVLPDEVPRATGERLLELGEAADVELGGQVIATAQQGPISSEIVGMAVAFIVLLIALGTIVAAGLPLILALFGLGIASALIMLLAAVLPTPDWSSTVAAMLGIGVGIRLRAADPDALPGRGRR